MPFKGRDPVGCTIVMYNNIIEQTETVNKLKTFKKDNRPTFKISKYPQITKIINRILKPENTLFRKRVTFWRYLL